MTVKQFRELLRGVDPQATLVFRPDWLESHVFHSSVIVPVYATEKKACRGDNSVDKFVEIGLTCKKLGDV